MYIHIHTLAAGSCDSWGDQIQQPVLASMFDCFDNC